MIGHTMFAEKKTNDNVVNFTAPKYEFKGLE